MQPAGSEQRALGTPGQPPVTCGACREDCYCPAAQAEVPLLWTHMCSVSKAFPLISPEHLFFSHLAWSVSPLDFLKDRASQAERPQSSLGRGSCCGVPGVGRAEGDGGGPGVGWGRGTGEGLGGGRGRAEGDGGPRGTGEGRGGRCLRVSSGAKGPVCSRRTAYSAAQTRLEAP